VDEACNGFVKSILDDDLCTFAENTLVWEEISTTGNTEDGKQITSSFRVPLQVSWPLYNLLSSIAVSVNQACAHTLAKTVVSDIWANLANRLEETYQKLLEALKSSSHPASLKQTRALQYYFDLQIVKQLLVSTRDDRLRQNQVQLLLELSKKFEPFVDPFDLHEFSPHIHSNLSKCGRGLTLLLGLLMPDALSAEANKSKASATKEVHNLLNATPIASFALLPTTRKSDKRKT
jgi:hypothetical protein